MLEARKSTKRDFEKFYNQHIDKVFRFVFFRVGERAKAEDLTAEIFLKVLEHFDSYDESRSKTSWLMTITKNHLANYWRDHKETVSTDAWIEEDRPEDGMLLSGAQRAQKREMARYAVAELLANLSPEERELVTLHYLAGYNYTEIAAMTGQTMGAVKVATFRVLKKLRQHL